MPPLTLSILASLLQVQGASATITSDNKGIDDLLVQIRGQLQEETGRPGAPQIIPVATHQKTHYSRQYLKTFVKSMR